MVHIIWRVDQKILGKGRKERRKERGERGEKAEGRRQG
jgi:hypothetical protein